MSGLLSSCEGYLESLLESGQGSRDASQVELGDQGSFSSSHCDFGTPIDFQE